MARRAKGEGTIFYDSSRNRWVGQMPAKPGAGGKRRRGRKVSGKTRREVAEKLADVRRRQSPVDRRRQTLGQYLHWFINEHQQQLVDRGEMRPQSARSYRQNLLGHVAPLAGHIRLADMGGDDASDVLSWIGDPSRDLEPSTQRLIYNQLRAALDQAVVYRWIPENPMKMVKPPRVPRTPRDILTPGQARELMAALEGYAHERLILTYLLTGTRVAEPLALSWKDVDLDAARIRLGWQLVRRDGAWHREPLKKRDAGEVRTIPMPPRLVDALRDERREQAALRLASRSWGNDWDLVFTGDRGQPIWPDYPRRALKDATARAWPDGGPNVTPHSLRRGAVSFLLADGVPLPTVMAILGHRDASMTLEVYAQAMDVTYDEAVRAMASVLG